MVDRFVPAPKVSSDEIGATTGIKKEVDELKKIVFMIIATLLVLGMVLPGCGEGEPEDIIYIAVAGPMTDLQGQNHWDGANMAVDEINDNGGVTVGGVTYDLALKKVDTKEATEGEDGSIGTAALQNVIDDVDFVVGGFRTEVVSVYREVAMDAQKLFMNCGAATGSLQFSVVTNYDKYKYWFKSTPYNETFLVKSCLKMTVTIGNVLKGTLATLEGMNATWVKDDFKLSLSGGKLKAHILMEDAAWCAGMVAAAQYYLPALGLTVTGTTLVSPTATDISTELNAIKALTPHIIFTAFSGSVGAVYSVQKASLGIPAMTIGINVPGQQIIHWANTDGKCEGEVLLDTWAEGLQNTSETAEWFADFMTRFSRYPVYTAGTYDAIKAVCAAMEATNSRDVDTIIAYLEDPTKMWEGSVASEKIGFYPMPDIEITPGELYGLTEAQVADYYDLASYGWSYNASPWLCGYVTGVQQPHIAHDLLYGPGYATGIGAQWQKISGAGKKVGVWPLDLGAPYDAALTDQYGCWNFAYPGTTPYILTIGGMLNIPWDPYA